MHKQIIVNPRLSKLNCLFANSFRPFFYLSFTSKVHLFLRLDLSPYVLLIFDFSGFLEDLHVINGQWHRAMDKTFQVSNQIQTSPFDPLFQPNGALKNSKEITVVSN